MQDYRFRFDFLKSHDAFVFCKYNLIPNLAQIGRSTEVRPLYGILVEYTTVHETSVAKI